MTYIRAPFRFDRGMEEPCYNARYLEKIATLVGGGRYKKVRFARLANPRATVQCYQVVGDVKLCAWRAFIALNKALVLHDKALCCQLRR